MTRALVVSVALCACGGGTSGNSRGDGGGSNSGGDGGSPITGPAPTAGGCSAYTGAVFCVDFDGSSDDISPYGWSAVTGDTSFVTMGVATSDGNRSFTIRETGTDLGDGTSQLYDLGSGSAVTLDLDLVSTIASATYTQVAFLALAADNNTLAQLELEVEADGTLELALFEVHSSPPAVPTTGKLVIGQWATVALHATFDQNQIAFSADAGAIGATPSPILAETTLALSFTPTQVAAQACLFPAAADPLAFEFDDVALTMP